MRFFMKQKVFSWGDKFTVKDEQENDCYNVNGEVFSLGHKLHVYDMNGAEIAYIHQKLLSLHPRFFINIQGFNEELELVKKFTFFNQEYYIANSSYVLEGNFSAHSYKLIDDGRVVMSVNKEWFTWGDSYVIDIENNEDILMGICVMLAVDCANADESHHTTNSNS